MWLGECDNSKTQFIQWNIVCDRDVDVFCFWQNGLK